MLAKKRQATMRGDSPEQKTSVFCRIALCKMLTLLTSSNYDLLDDFLIRDYGQDYGA